MTLMSLIVFLIVVGLAFWATRTIGGALSIPEPILTVLYVLGVILVVVYILSFVAGGNLQPFRGW